MKKNHITRLTMCKSLFSDNVAIIIFNSKKIKNRELKKIYNCEDIESIMDYSHKLLKKIYKEVQQYGTK